MVREYPRKAAIITLQRTGGTFLAFCLSNHPEIFCARGEPMARRSYWKDGCPDYVQRLEIILGQQYYAVAMCKMTDSHAFNAGVWEYICEQRPRIKILALTRENILAQAVSHEINAGKREGWVTGHPTHTWRKVDPPPVRLDPESVLKRCRSESGRYVRVEANLRDSKLPVLNLTYWDIARGQDAREIPEETAKRICRFLRVPFAPLYTNMRKVHRRPLAETVANWGEVVKAIKGTEYEKFLQDKWEGH